MKVFIPQPMRGKTDEEILAIREKIIAGIKNHFPDETIEIADSFFEEAPTDAKLLWFPANNDDVILGPIAVF